MNYTRFITLDVNAATAMTVINVKRSDAFTRFINITLMKDGAKYTPEAGVWVMFRCEKPDGKGVITDSRYEDEELNRHLVVLNGDGTITVELIGQVTTCVGRCMCDICLLSEGKVLSTTPFIINVQPIPNVANLAISSDDFRTLINIISEIEDIENKWLSKVGTLTLPVNWAGNGPYTQAITVSGYSPTYSTKVDLVCDSAVIDSMTNSGTNIIYVSNDNGVLTAYAIGGAPTESLTVQVVVSETQPV